MRKSYSIVIIITLAIINFAQVKCYDKLLKKTTFLKGPYLIYPNNNTEMEILWQSDSPASISQIEWGPTPDYGNGPFTVPAYGDNQYKYKISALTPQTIYYYRINIDNVYQTGSFRTAPLNSATSVTFYVYGDTRTQPDKQSEVLSSLLNDMNQLPSQRQTMLLHTGDWVSDGDEEEKWNEEFFNRNYPKLLEVHSKLPIMGARGNHEGSGALLRKYFPYPYQSQNGFYYSFDYGPTHITIIDDNITRDPNSEQYNWIMADVNNSTKLWKIMVFHQPAWGAGTHDNNIPNQILTSNIFENNKVTLVLAGHDHLYAHCYKNPIHHITTGGGGAPLYDINPSKPYYVTASKNYHFLRIDINNNLLCLTAIGTAGEVYDNFCIENQAPGSVHNTLTLSKINNDIQLNWQPPNSLCNPLLYSIYRGTLPLFTYNHIPIACAISETHYTDVSPQDSFYYLVTSMNSNYEGSYGKKSNGTEIPQSISPCAPQNTNTC